MRLHFDPDRSTVTIHASSSIHPIRTSTAVTGWVELDDEGRATGGEVELSLAEMRSGNPLIDREAERRLDVGRHPTVTGRLNELGPADGDGGHAGAGELTFHGVTRTIHGTLRIDGGADGHHLTGETTFDVTDFGVQPPSLLVVKVHADVRIELDAHATP